MTANEADAFDELAVSPERVTGDEGTVKERNAKDAIELDQYAQAKRVSGPPYGMRMARVKFPGTP
jgi:hypothetical protein